MTTQVKVNGKKIAVNGIQVGEIWGYQKGEYKVKNLSGASVGPFTYFSDAVSYAKNNADFFN